MTKLEYEIERRKRAETDLKEARIYYISYLRKIIHRLKDKDVDINKLIRDIKIDLNAKCLYPLYNECNLCSKDLKCKAPDMKCGYKERS